MIKTFADRHTRDLYVQGKSKRFPPEITRRAIRKLEYLDLATGLDDLKVPPSNRLHELERERSRQFSISAGATKMPLTFSITDGIAFGFISYTLLKVVTGRAKEVHWLIYVFSLLFIIRYSVPGLH